MYRSGYDPKWLLSCNTASRASNRAALAGAHSRHAMPELTTTGRDRPYGSLQQDQKRNIGRERVVITSTIPEGGDNIRFRWQAVHSSGLYTPFLWRNFSSLT